jgi:DNA polymerase I-like protein with 3'-5' exonuclease and polymerase domains
MNDYKVYHGIRNLAKLNSSDKITFDCETLQLKPEMGKLRLLQLGSRSPRRIVVVVDLFKLDEAGLKQLDLFFQEKKRTWLAHNAAFDLGWLAAYGWYPKGQIQDSMLASKLLTNGKTNVRHGLQHVAKRYLDIELDKEEQRSDWSGDLTDSQLNYAANDVEVLCELDKRIHSELADEALQYSYMRECAALPALVAMANTGIPFDKAALQATEKDYEKDIENLAREFHLELDEALPEGEKLPRDPDGAFNLRTRTTGSVKLGTKQYAGFNIGSSKQFLEKISIVLGYTPVSPTTKKPSTDKRTMQEHIGEHPLIATYMQWKRAEKRRQMVAALIEHQSPDGFVRASYWQLGAETGRMTCSDPNLQQIPRDEQFRASVVAPAGWSFIDADFSQMELRLLAIVAEDENMCNAFIEGKDLHTVTSEALGCDRQIAKSANFGLAYGSGAKGLRNYAAGMGVQLTLEQATDVRDQWLDTYSGVKEWHKTLGTEANKGASDAVVRIPVTNMRRFLPGEMNRLTVRANTPVQGAGAAVLKCALSELWKDAKGSDEVKICAAVHDELLLLVREGKEEKWAAILQKAMEGAEAKWLGSVPAVADVKIGKTWQECH